MLQNCIGIGAYRDVQMLYGLMCQWYQKILDLTRNQHKRNVSVIIPCGEDVSGKTSEAFKQRGYPSVLCI